MEEVGLFEDDLLWGHPGHIEVLHVSLMAELLFSWLHPNPDVRQVRELQQLIDAIFAAEATSIMKQK